MNLIKTKSPVKNGALALKKLKTMARFLVTLILTRSMGSRMGHFVELN
jgi:hypothetical protein